MQIWIKFGDLLALCNRFCLTQLKTEDYAIRAYDFSFVKIPFTIGNLTEQEAKSLMREISEAVANGDTYFEIPAKYCAKQISNEKE